MLSGAGKGSKRSGRASETNRAGISIQNVAPRPSIPWHPMEPPISSMSVLQTASPSPVPPKRRVVELSACVNASNSR
jgi:hypothetical protein